MGIAWILLCIGLGIGVLAAFQRHLRDDRPKPPSRPRAPTIREGEFHPDFPRFAQRVLFLRLAIYLCCGAAVMLVIWSLAETGRAAFPQNVQLWPLVAIGLLATSPLSLGGTWLGRRMLRGFGGAAPVLRELWLAAFAVACIGVFGAVQANLGFGDDRTREAVLEVISVDAYSFGSGKRRGNTRPLEFLTLGPSSDGALPRQTYRSRDYISRQLWPGDRVRVHWRSGLLGVPVIVANPERVATSKP